LVRSFLLEELPWPQKLLKHSVNAACPPSTVSAWPGRCLRTGDSRGQAGARQALPQSWLCPWHLAERADHPGLGSGKGVGTVGVVV